MMDPIRRALHRREALEADLQVALTEYRLCRVWDTEALAQAALTVARITDRLDMAQRRYDELVMAEMNLVNSKEMSNG